MGFKRVQPISEKPKILLIASLAQASADGLADYAVGVDAGLLPIHKLSSEVKTIGEMSQAMPDIPWGGWLRNTTKSNNLRKFLSLPNILPNTYNPLWRYCQHIRLIRAKE
jgi:hypothetical protein